MEVDAKDGDDCLERQSPWLAERVFEKGGEVNEESNIDCPPTIEGFVEGNRLTDRQLFLFDKVRAHYHQSFVQIETFCARAYQLKLLMGQHNYKQLYIERNLPLGSSIS